MKVTTYGTRGSTPIARADAIRFGGNTTCLRIKSECLPPGMALAVDSGSGYMPLSNDLLKEKVMDVSVCRCAEPASFPECDRGGSE